MREFVRTLVSRVSGFSTAFFGMSWVPPSNERVAARNIILLLEDRRVLFAPHECEMPRACLASVQEIRLELTSFLRSCPEGTIVEDATKLMRASCRRFLERCGNDEEIREHGTSSGHWASWIFLPAIGELRAQIGQQVAIPAETYEITVTGELLNTMPPGDTE